MHHNAKSNWLPEELDYYCLNNINDFKSNKEHKILVGKSDGDYPLFPYRK